METLLLDARWLITGLGTYTTNLIRELCEHAPDIPFALLTLSSYHGYLRQFNRKITIVDVPIYSVREQFAVASAARGFGCLHVPHYNAPLAHRGPLLVTIHDLTHIVDQSYRRNIKSWMYSQPMLRLVGKRANHIFTVSEYSKRNIIEHLGVEAQRISVVYCAAGPHIFPEAHDVANAKVNRDFGFVGPYILFVGNLKPHKNVIGLLRAFAIVRERRRIAHSLLVIGDDAKRRPAILALSRDLKIGGAAVFVRQVSPEQIRTAYSGADLTVLPSFEEGFGLPVLESMTCGTPVACSGAASLPEVAGLSAEYFDPHDVESIAEAIETVLLSDDRWRTLRELGLQRALSFLREEFGQRHFAVYRRFLGKN